MRRISPYALAVTALLVACGGSPIKPSDRIIVINATCALASPLSASLTIVRITASSLVSERVRFPSRMIIRWLNASSRTV